MVMQVPLQAIPSQQLQIVLGNQNCQINVYQKSTGLYFDLLVNNAPITTAVICRDAALLVRRAYLGFVGDFSFIDVQGTEDPEYAGLNTRWALIYFEAADLA
jgi:hypothetical protein